MSRLSSSPSSGKSLNCALKLAFSDRRLAYSLSSVAICSVSDAAFFSIRVIVSFAKPALAAMRTISLTVSAAAVPMPAD